MMGAYRLLWWSIAAPIGLVGVAAAMVSSSIPTAVTMFGIVALCLGVLSANLQSLDGEGRGGGSISASTMLRHGCAAGFVVVSFYGMASLIEVAVLPLALLVAVTCPPVVARWRARDSLPSPIEGGTRTDPTPTTDRGEHSAPALQTLTDPELCLAWRRSFVELQRTDAVEALTEIVAFRQQVLDELERRDPGGFSEWLAAGARAPSDPARYLHDRPDGQR